jgi:hypothetical protein
MEDHTTDQVQREEDNREQWVESMCRGIAERLNRPGVMGNSAELGFQVAYLEEEIRISEENPPAEDSKYKTIDGARLQAAQNNLVTTMEIQLSNEVRYGSVAKTAFDDSNRDATELFRETNYLLAVDGVREEQHKQLSETGKGTNLPSYF